MQTYEKKDDWRSSQGRMKEVAPKNEQEHQRHLTGYQPSEQERNEKTAPVEVGRMASTFGDVAVGVTGANKLVFTTSKRRTEGAVATRQDEKSVRGDGIYRISGTRNMAYTNPHDRGESALAFREPGNKAPAFMRKRFASMVEKKDVETAQEMLPFLDVDKDRKRQQALLATEQGARRSGDGAQARQSANRRSALAQEITEKEVQQRRFQQMLAKGQAAARDGAGTKWEMLRRGLETEGEILDEDDKPLDDENDAFDEVDDQI